MDRCLCIFLGRFRPKNRGKRDRFLLVFYYTGFLCRFFLPLSLPFSFREFFFSDVAMCSAPGTTYDVALQHMRCGALLRRPNFFLFSVVFWESC